MPCWEMMRWSWRVGELCRGYKKASQILRRPRSCQTDRQLRPASSRPSPKPSGHRAIAAASETDARNELTRKVRDIKSGVTAVADVLRQRKGRRAGREGGQVATYLLHLVERAMIDARLLEVILRGLDHLLDDLLVHAALVVAVSKPAFTLPPLACAPWGY